MKRNIILSFFAALLLSTLSFAQFGDPTVRWTASVSDMDPTSATLVLEGKVAEGMYMHPYAEKSGGLTVELVPGITIAGNPEESFVKTQYKGADVVSGDYAISIPVSFAEGTACLHGTVCWICCIGDECRAPEEWDFDVKIGAHGPADEISPVVEPAPENAPNSLWALVLEAILWGLAMLLTPCVFPMVPMTVSFFMKGSSSSGEGRFKASMYGMFIVLLYTVPICFIIGATWLFGGESVTADIFNWLSTHWLPNLVFFAVFMVFAASFFGAFEIVLPSRWTNSADRGSDRKGLAGVFFLALTLVLVSFSCTGPIVGTVLIKSTRGEFWTPMVTMLAFSVAFALPFTVLAFFPSLLKKLPKSGSWLNSVKVVLGFIEIALGFKFLSTADQTYHWHLLDREVYLAIWITCFTLLGFYLLGKLKFRNDENLEYISVKRLALAIASFSFVVYMIPGMWGAPLRALSGYLPPIETQDFVLGSSEPSAAPTPVTPDKIDMPHGLVAYDNIEDALVEAKAAGKRVFVDITGHGCVNCREMESRVWSDPEVRRILAEEYVMVALYTDDKMKLPESRWITTESGKVLKDLGRVNSYIARERFGVNAQPNYALLDAEGRLLSPIRGYDLSIPGFVEFLTASL